MATISKKREKPPIVELMLSLKTELLPALRTIIWSGRWQSRLRQVWVHFQPRVGCPFFLTAIKKRDGGSIEVALGVEALRARARLNSPMVWSRGAFEDAQSLTKARAHADIAA